MIWKSPLLRTFSGRDDLEESIEDIFCRYGDDLEDSTDDILRYR